MLQGFFQIAIGGLLSAIGIAGMDRVAQFNVIATSGRAVEACGDVNTLILDKTGTITLGNRLAEEFIPVNSHSMEEVARIALSASVFDKTPEGKSIVLLAEKLGAVINGVQFRPLSANQLLKRNILVYGLGGLLAPFIAIKLIDVAIASVGLV